MTDITAPPPVPHNDSCVIPILGMHRSGTSMFTRALQLLGVDLGEPLMAPQPDNPKGFWENEFFYEVDLKILHVLQRHVSGYGRRDELLQLPALSTLIQRSDEDLQTIQNYIDSQFSASRVWGWKDPRSVLLFPFWLGALVELGYRRIRPMVVTRHPSSCVRSLVRRTDLDPLAAVLGIDKTVLALEMWVAYSHILLDIVEETDAYVTVHDWFMDQESAEAELLRAASRCPGLFPGPDKGAAPGNRMAQALAWLDPGAVHHAEPETLSGPMGEEALDLYSDLLTRARRQRADWKFQDRPAESLTEPELLGVEPIWRPSPAATAS
ncbi:MAG: hypothetical protein HN712_06330 [Gemmatimonadetes bacterium]|jgi:hypothetical protein|nr:hypothetical protein [Gemmatimonadota bacterium]MBT6145341.1 hypothetical protein [Gemmatimonadota bacterium]MBT7859910.1 hypothetical protein [Gemmatimonadota bacterium]